MTPCVNCASDVGALGWHATDLGCIRALAARVAALEVSRAASVAALEAASEALAAIRFTAIWCVRCRAYQDPRGSHTCK